MEQSSHKSRVTGITRRVLAEDAIIDGTVIGTRVGLLLEGWLLCKSSVRFFLPTALCFIAQISETLKLQQFLSVLALSVQHACVTVCVLSVGAGEGCLILAARCVLHGDTLSSWLSFSQTSRKVAFSRKDSASNLKPWAKFGHKLFDKGQECELRGWEPEGTGQEAWPTRMNGSREPEMSGGFLCILCFHRATVEPYPAQEEEEVCFACMACWLGRSQSRTGEELG